MVKNTAGGCKGKKIARKDTVAESRYLRSALDKDETYAQVTVKFGGNELEVLTIDGIKRRCSIRGKFRSGGNRKKNFVTVFCWVLVGLRAWSSDSHCDLLHVYTDSEKHQLKETYHMVNWSVFDENERNSGIQSGGSGTHASSSSSELLVEFSNTVSVTPKIININNSHQNNILLDEMIEDKITINVDDI